MASLLTGCTHQKVEREPIKFEYQHATPYPGFNYLAPFAIAYQLGKIPVGSSQPVIWGHCLVIQRDKDGNLLGDPHPCPETFIEVKTPTNKDGFKVWLNAKGEFEIPFTKGQTYRLRAVCERYSIRSDEIQLGQPGKVVLTINHQ